MKFIKSHRMAFVFLLYFTYSLGVSATIQGYIVPNIFPQFDRGDGIITLDGDGFNQIAKAKAKEINENGWGAWELRPKWQAPAGIASIFYTLINPTPYSVLPYNALVHAISGCLVVWLLLLVFPWKPAFFGSLFFVTNPAALQWVAQIHRDGIFILGNLLLLVCLVQYLNGLKYSNIKTMLTGFVCGVIGTFFVWLARPYFVQILFVFVLLGILFIGFSCWAKGEIHSRLKWHVLVLTFCLLLFQGWVVKYHSPHFLRLPTVLTQSPPAEKASQLDEEIAPQIDEEIASQIDEEIAPQKKQWIRTEWLPLFVEQKLYHISVARRGAIGTGGKSLVDGDVPLNSAPAFIAYFPRALQLGLLSPLPELWSGEGSTPALTLARKVMGVITLFFYFCLLGLLSGMVTHWKNQVAGLIFIFSFFGILVFTYTYPNIGTLLRFRYGFYMLLISFGVANIMEMLFRWQKKY